MRYFSTPRRAAKIIVITIPKDHNVLEKLDLSYIVGGNIK
jgi:hypothetical protein